MSCFCVLSEVDVMMMLLSECHVFVYEVMMLLIECRVFVYEVSFICLCMK